MHTILGAGGPVANALTKELLNHGQPVRLISRTEINTFPAANWLKADLKNNKEVMKAVKGSSVIYMTAGLKYDKKIWAEEWPIIMRNIIDAAKETGARLIFFDNVYMYGLVDGVMTEETPYNPSSKKGEVRAQIATQLMDETKKGNIRASIARAADFYGAETLNSFCDSMVLQKLKEGKPAMWLGNPHKKHSFTFVPDAGKAMYLLGNVAKTDNQIWHVPTASALTGKEFIELAAAAFKAKPKYSSVNKFMLTMAGIFNPLIRETLELFYQYRYDYVFDSSKFEKEFAVQPTSYKDGLEMVFKTTFEKKNLDKKLS